MKIKVALFTTVLLILALASQAAFAANCEFTFTANGKTYYVIHNTTEGYYQCLNPEKYAIQTFNNPSPEDIAWERGLDAAKDQHHAACPYVNGDLGDERVPMTLLYGGAALAAASAIIVHQKRTRIQ